MGLFSDTTVVSVASTAYNLAGPEANRPNYLKTAVTGGILTPQRTLTESITAAYLNGPGINLRNFGDWCEHQGYSTAVGMGDAGKMSLVTGIDAAALSPLVPHPSDQTAIVQTSEIGQANYSFWVHQYMATNHPNLLTTAYTSSFDGTTVTVTLADTSVETFVPSGYDRFGEYLYVSYTLMSVTPAGTLVTGTTVVLSTADSLPGTTGWTVDSLSSIPISLNVRTQTHSTYSDGRPATDTDTTTTTPSGYNTIAGTWEKTTYLGLVTDPLTNSSSISSNRQVMVQSQTGSPATPTVTTSTTTTTITGGIIQTTVTTTTIDAITISKSYRIDMQPVLIKTWSDFQVFIYKRGSGIAGLDAFFVTTTNGGTYLPYIPIRVNNHFVSPTYLGDVYPLAKKALKKSLGASFDDLVTKVNNNPHIADIDFAYVVFGVSLNTQENNGRKYIYQFFKQAMLGEDLTGSGFLTWWAAVENIYAQRAAWFLWVNAQSQPTDPLYDTGQPLFNPDGGDFLAYPPPPSYTVKIASAPGSVMGFDMVIGWNGIIETTNAGLGKPGAKVGDIWFESGSRIDSETSRIILTGQGSLATPALNISYTLLKWQVDASSYKMLKIYGLNHNNYIYDGSSVFIPAEDALLDPSESGFIIPLNTAIYRSMSLVDATQMSTACAYLVINTVTIRKIPWYTSGFFQVFITIVIIIVAVAITVYTGGAATPGLLGTAGSVGTTMGFTGTAAVIAGAAVNAIAAMIVVQIITQASTGIFGAKTGAIVGAIASLAVVTSATGFMSNLSSVSLYDQLTSAQNLMKMTISTFNGVSSLISANGQDELKQAQDVMASYNTQSQAIQDKYNELTSSAMVIDPLALTNTFQSVYVETPADFFARTLMTGSDIAGLSMDMLTHFTNINLTTDLPI